VAAAFALGIAALLLVPLPVPELEPGSSLPIPLDKLVHFLLFLFAARPWERSVRLAGIARAGVATVVLAAVYAGLLELLQPVVSSGRMADGGDLAASLLGTLAGLWLPAGRPET
jgi:hypothetical protein